MQNAVQTICVIVPTYNEERTIGNCIESIRTVTRGYPIELIIVDNGSTDLTREIAEALGAKVIVDSSRHVSGLRNLGASQTNAEILAFVDADCIVAADWVENAQHYFDKSDVSVWGSPPTHPKPGTWVQRAWDLVRRKRNQVQDVTWLESMNLWVRREVFIKTGGFNEELVTCEDVDFCYRAAAFGRIVADQRIRVVHLGEAATISHFAKKELWRGQSNWAAMKSHGLPKEEIKNVIMPLYFGLLLPLSIVAFFLLKSGPWMLVPLFLFLAPAVAGLYRVRGKGAKWIDYAGLFVLLQIYFLCRTISTASGLYKHLHRARQVRLRS